MFSTIKLYLIVLFISVSLISVKGQLSVFAGPDTILCDTNVGEYQLGNYVSIIGDFPPYSYSWSCTYRSFTGKYFYGRSFLNDTSISHPTFISQFDSLSFALKVTDSQGNISQDSVTFRVSSFLTMVPIECKEYIYEGDSVELFQTIVGGVEPLSFNWEPTESLSDPTASSPWAKPDTSTVYHLVITDAAGCIGESFCDIIVSPTGNDIFELPESYIRMYPNPTNKSSYLIIEKLIQSNCYLQLFDLVGSLIFEQCINEEFNQLNVEDLASGVYIYKVSNLKELFESGKLIIN